MNEAVVAGAIAGAVAGVIASAAVIFATRGMPRPGQWQARTMRHTSTFTRDPQFAGRETAAPPPGEWMQRVYTPNPPINVTTPGLFDRFDESGKRVVGAAQAEALRANHNYMGTEHLLLGLLVADSTGPAGRALARHGITLDKARTALEFIVGRGDATVSPTEITLSPRTKKVLELSVAEAHRLGRPMAGAAEILLGLLAEGEGIACGIIESLGAPLDGLRSTVLGELHERGRGPEAHQPPLFQQAPQAARVQHASGPFDRFDDRAKRVLALAQDEAIRFNHNYIGPEHIVLGLIREGEGIAARVLGSLGVEMSRLRMEVDGLIGRGDSTTSPSEITLVPRTKKLIELAIDESRILGHSIISTEHLLLAIVRDPGSNAGEVLRRVGVDLESVRKKVIELLSGGPPPSS